MTENLFKNLDLDFSRLLINFNKLDFVIDFLKEFLDIEAEKPFLLISALVKLIHHTQRFQLIRYFKIYLCVFSIGNDNSLLIFNVLLFTKKLLRQTSPDQFSHFAV